MLRVNEQEGIKDQSARLLLEESRNFEEQHRDDFSIDLIQMYDMYLERLAEESRLAQTRLDEIKPELDKEKEKVMEARRKRRVVELLKERRKEEYDLKIKKAEQRELQELNQSRPSPGMGRRKQERIYGNQRTRDVEEDRELMEEEWDRDREVDAIADYYQQLGIPDPRDKNRRS